MTSNGEQQELLVHGARFTPGTADAPSTVRLQPGTVQSYSDAPPTPVIVRPDGSMTDIPARSILNQPLSPGMRVMLAWDPPGGCYVIGIIGRVPPPYIVLIQPADQAIVNLTETTVNYTSLRASTTDMYQSAGTVTLPYTGLYSVTAQLNWGVYISAPAGIIRQEWARIERLDAAGAFVEVIAAWAKDNYDTTAEVTINANLSQGTWPCKASDKLRVRVWHDSGTFNRTLLATGPLPSFTVRWVGPAEV